MEGNTIKWSEAKRKIAFERRKANGEGLGTILTDMRLL